MERVRAGAGRFFFNGILGGMVLLISALSVFSCGSATGGEALIKELEDYLAKVESEWETPAAAEEGRIETYLGKIRELSVKIQALDPAGLSPETEKRRTEVLREALVDTLLLVDDAYKAESPTPKP